MQLPFTREQFFDLFAAYNEPLWPAVVALWIASTAIVAWRLSARRPHDRWVSALLAGHWAWSALAYHIAFFTRINPAAWLFAALFFGQAVLVFRVGVVQRRLSFAPRGNAWAPLAWGLIAYSLAYPVINAIDHRSLLRVPTFGLPCPTTIFTAGVLMLATPRCWSLAVVPVIWSAIGGSAALVLGVSTDVALPIAGVALVIFFGATNDAWTAASRSGEAASTDVSSASQLRRPSPTGRMRAAVRTTGQIADRSRTIAAPSNPACPPGCDAPCRG